MEENNNKKKKKIKKKKKLSRRILIAIIGAVAPGIIFVLPIMMILSSFGSFFGSSNTSDRLSQSDNDKVIEYAKEVTSEKADKLKDHYGTDKNYILEYQYIIAYMKYMSAADENKGNNGLTTLNEFKRQVKKSADELWPEFTYKDEKITTIREYKVIVKKFKEKQLSVKVLETRPEDLEEYDEGQNIYIYDENITLVKEKDGVITEEKGKPSELRDIQIYETRPRDLSPEQYEADQKIYIISESKCFITIQEEEWRTERKDVTKEFVTKVESIKATVEFTYETKTDVLKKEDEIITTIKPVLKDMKQLDEDWSVFRAKIKEKYPDEDTEEALEMILASATAMVNDTVKLDMIYTGGGAGAVTPEEFTGDQAECVKKIYESGAKDLYEKYNILPSITIAQATIESNWGKSGLTQKANNLFGVKAFSSWSGAYVEMLTYEYDGNGNKYQILARFRAYNSWKESIEDYGKVICQPNFEGVRTASNYREAAMALKTGGYATDINYVNMVISRIEQYKLYEYDHK